MKVLATNRRARFDYDVNQTLQAGMVLNGAEVKSTKQGHISLKGSYVNLVSGELFLINAHISPYKFAGVTNFDPIRSRKLLVHKAELDRLIGLKQQGLAMVPLAVGLVRGRIKIEIGVGRGRKKYDKREIIKNREADRAIARATRAKKR